MSQVAILLVSADYLTSAWITREELPALLKQEAERGLRIVPLIVRPSLWKRTPLAYYQLLPRDGKALSLLSESQQDQVFVELVDKVLASIRDPVQLRESQKGTQGTKKGDDQAVSVQPKTDERSKETQKRPSLFISHSKDDGDFAENLKFTLEKEGFLGWIDTDVLEAGADWRQGIDDAILKSIAVILVLSPEAKKSEYVTYEWAFALGSGLRIVPLMLKETPIHPRLEIFQYLDFTNRRARPWSRLLSLLHEISDFKTADWKK